MPWPSSRSRKPWKEPEARGPALGQFLDPTAKKPAAPRKRKEAVMERKPQIGIEEEYQIIDPVLVIFALMLMRRSLSGARHCSKRRSRPRCMSRSSRWEPGLQLYQAGQERGRLSAQGDHRFATECGLRRRSTSFRGLARSGHHLGHALRCDRGGPEDGGACRRSSASMCILALRIARKLLTPPRTRCATSSRISWALSHAFPVLARGWTHRAELIVSPQVSAHEHPQPFASLEDYVRPSCSTC